MKIQRTLPPAAAPLTLPDILRGFAGIIAPRRYLTRLESELKEYFDVKYVFLVSSGKAALTLILTSLASLSPRRKVLIPAYTCYSVPSAILKAGLDVSLCDIDPATLDFDFALLEQSLDPHTLCVVPTHLLGLSSDMDRVKELSRKAGVLVVEDAAQAMGGRYKGKPVGSQGDVGFVSFGRGKNITCGAGGLVVTNSDSAGRAIQKELAKLDGEPQSGTLRRLVELLAIRILIRPRLYWLPAGLPVLRLGETLFHADFPMYRLSGASAAILSHWKSRLEYSNRSRSATAHALVELLPPGVQTIQARFQEHPAYLRLPLLLDDRSKEKLCAISKSRGLGIGPLYPRPIHEVDELRSTFSGRQFPAATLVAQRLVTLPVHHFVAPEDYERIVSPIRTSIESFESPDRFVPLGSSERRPRCT